MWEVRLHKSVEEEWGTIMPLSAEIVIPPLPSIRPPHRRIGSSSSLSVLKRFQAKRSASTLTTVQTPTTPLPSPSVVSEQESSHNLLVTTLIAMPSPSRSNSRSSLLKGKQRKDEKEGVPPVMFGTVEVFLNWDREVPTPTSEEVKEEGSLIDDERTASA